MYVLYYMKYKKECNRLIVGWATEGSALVQCPPYSYIYV
ncbi:hypothetical protein H1P_3470002 [Hyella patelloides LEGE 07179]|uniref:Uncharacterized protein n=1 Tax=Hyella patelloides LEGE 07179 TaxID=945734 RepID=A0A563VWC5_9CYAN|nr:hypothetical protein H1P_3470002 [Hyella patelloides LEGE 07179]